MSKNANWWDSDAIADTPTGNWWEADTIASDSAKKELPADITPSEGRSATTYTDPRRLDRQEAPAPTKAAAEPKPYRDKREALDDAVNLIEEGYDQSKVAESFAKAGIKLSDIVAHGQKRGSDYFKEQRLSPEEVKAAQARPAAPVGEIKNLRTEENIAGGDVALAGAKGLVGGFKMLMGAGGAGKKATSYADQALDTADKYLDGLRSAAAVQDDGRISQIMDDAKNGDWTQQVSAAAKAFSVAPASMVAQGLGTSVPAILAVLLPGARESTIIRLASRVGVGAIMGAGSTKEAIYDTVKDDMVRSGVPKFEAEERARAAQEYLGKNQDQIAIGMALGALASSTGLEKAIPFKQVSNVLAKSGASRALAAAEQNAAGRLAIGAVAEAAPEFLQGSAEQVAQNVALQREGREVPTFQGAIGQGALEGLAGAGSGGLMSAAFGRPLTAKEQAARELAGLLNGGEFTAAGVNADVASQLRTESVNNQIRPEATVVNFTEPGSATDQAGLTPIVVPVPTAGAEAGQATGGVAGQQLAGVAGPIISGNPDTTQDQDNELAKQAITPAINPTIAQATQPGGSQDSRSANAEQGDTAEAGEGGREQIDAQTTAPAIVGAPGKPFATEPMAWLYAAQQKLQGYQPTQTESGWQLSPIQPGSQTGTLGQGIANPQAMPADKETAMVQRLAAAQQASELETEDLATQAGDLTPTAGPAAGQVAQTAQTGGTTRMVSSAPQGKPFATEKSATVFAQGAGLENPKIIPVDGGYSVEHDAPTQVGAPQGAPQGQQTLRLNPIRGAQTQAEQTAGPAGEGRQEARTPILALTAPRSHFEAVRESLANEGVTIAPVPVSKWTQDQRIASEFARAIGRTFTVFSGTSATTSSVPNGFVGGFGSPHIFVHEGATDAPISVVAHEVMHSLPERERKVLEQALLGYFRQDKRAEFLKGMGYKDADFTSEAAAFMVQALTKHPEFWTDLQQRIGARDFTAIAKLILSKLDSLMARYPQGIAGRFEQEFITDIKAAREVLAAAYANAINSQNQGQTQGQSQTSGADPVVASRPAPEPAEGQPAASDHQPAGAVFTVQGSRKSPEGFKTLGDAHMASERAKRIRPDLDFKVEQKPSGRYMLAGYPKDQPQADQSTVEQTKVEQPTAKGDNTQTKDETAQPEATPADRPETAKPETRADAEPQPGKDEQPAASEDRAESAEPEQDKPAPTIEKRQVLRANAAKAEAAEAAQDSTIEPQGAAQPGFDGAQPAMASLGLPAWTQANDLRSNLQDRFFRVRQLQQAITNTFGVEISEEQDAYLAEELSYGRAQARIDLFKSEAVEPLLKALEAGKLSLDELALYAYAKHAPERNAYLKKQGVTDGAGMTDAEARKILEAFAKEDKAQALEDAHARLMGINQATRDLQLAEGLITPGQHRAWSRMFKNYVPLKGLAEREVDPIANKTVDGGGAEGGGQASAAGGWEVSGEQSLAALGRNSKASQIVEQSIANYARASQLAVKNSIGKALVALADAHPDDSVWSFVWEPGANTFTVKMQGRDIHLEIKDAQLLKALKQEGGEIADSLVKTVEALGKWTRFSGQILTRYNPLFGAANAARDASWAGTVAFAELGAEGAIKYAAHYANLKQSGKAWEEFIASGALTGGFHMQDADKVGEELQALVRWHGGAGAKAAKSFDMARDALEWIGQRGENQARFALYKAGRDKGLSPAKAASLSKKSTNFNRRGNWARTLGALYMFVNAGAQGAHSAVRLVGNPRFQAFAAGATAATIAAVFANVEMGGEDDDGIPLWDKVPEFDKQNNLIIMLPPGTEVTGINQYTGAETVGKTGRYIKIPLPHPLRVISSAGIAIADGLRHAQNPRHGASVGKGAANVVGALFNAVNPLGGSMDPSNSDDILIGTLPTLASQAYQLHSGHDAFGRKTSDEARKPEGTPDSENVSAAKYGGAAHNITRWLNSVTGGNEAKPGAIDIAPGTVEQVTAIATGGVGKFAAGTMELAAALTGDTDLPAHKTVLVKAFYGQADKGTEPGRFYELKETIDKLQNTEKRSMKKAIRQDWTPEERRMLAMGEAVDSMAAQIGRVNAELREVMDSDKLPAKEQDLKRVALLNRRAKMAEDFMRSAEMQMRGGPK